MDEESVWLLKNYQDGDPQAASEIFHRYVGRLIALARARISSGLGQRVDAEDVVQSVYRSFFAHADDGKYAIERSGDLWALLAAITVNKVRKKARFHGQQKRAMSRESSPVGESGEFSGDVGMLAEGPTPDDAIAVTDELEAIMNSLDERKRSVLELRLQGKGLAEISEEVGRSQRTVRRTLEDVEKLMRQRLLETTDG